MKDTEEEEVLIPSQVAALGLVLEDESHPRGGEEEAPALVANQESGSVKEDQELAAVKEQFLKQSQDGEERLQKKIREESSQEKSEGGAKDRFLARSQEADDIIQSKLQESASARHSDPLPVLDVGNNDAASQLGNLNAEQSENVPPPPPSQTTLAPSSRIRVSQPGAFAETPGIDNSDPRQPEEGAQSSDASNLSSNDDDVSDYDVELGEPQPPSDNAGIAVAREVPDNESTDGLELAQEFDPKVQAKKQRQEQIYGVMFLMVAVLIIATAVAVGVSSNKTTASPDTEPSSPTTIQTWNPTPAPTSLLSDFMSQLPEYSLRALEQIDSPQKRALNWLSEHPNLPEFPEWKKLQLYVLVTFYHALDGDNWPRQVNQDWLDVNKDECYWFSDAFIEHDHDVWNHPDVYIRQQADEEKSICIPDEIDSQFPGHYFHLGLEGVYGMKLATPKLPREIALLSHLQAFHIVSNLDLNAEVTDLVPVELQENLDLKSLQLWGNVNISGTIPEYIWQMSNLQHINMESNRIEGAISSQVGTLWNLTHLELGHNKMTGKLPSELGLLSRLTTLIASNNMFNGHFPTEVWELTTLRELAVDLKEDPFPSEVGLLPKLELLHIFDSPVKRTFPSEIYQLTRLEALWLENNTFTGTLSTEVGLLSNLFDFAVLQSPNLVGSLPSEVGLMAQVNWIVLGGTSLSGTLPSELGLLVDLEGIEIHNTFLTGSIPEAVCDLPIIEVINIDCDLMTCNCGGICDGSMECNRIGD